MVSCPLESVTPKLWREASTYPADPGKSKCQLRKGGSKQDSQWASRKELWVEGSLGRVELAWQGWRGTKNLSQRTSGGDMPPSMWTPTLFAVPGTQQQHKESSKVCLYIIFFLYKWIHSLLAVTLCKSLKILVPQFPPKMKHSI